MTRSGREPPAARAPGFFSAPRLALALATVALLLPFAAKAFHIDDPLFVWTARHVVGHPLDFYGFSVNWIGTSTPMAEETKNPPFAAFVIALVGSAAGWSETALHLGFLPVAVASVLGTRALAERFCPRADLAALIFLVAPAFLVSVTTLMCDSLLLAFYVWAIWFFVRGLDRGSLLAFCTAGLLAALAVLTKYFGATLIPLFLAYGLARKRRLGLWMAGVAIPVAVLAAYEWLTLRLYGQGLFAEAAGYAVGPVRAGGLISRTITALAFSGACFAPVLFFLHSLRWRRWLVGLSAGTLLGAFLLALAGRVGRAELIGAAGPRWGLALQIALWTCVGSALLSLAVLDFRSRRDADSALLGLWLVGTFLFTAFVNWTINVRSVLPMAPAVAILLVRRIEGVPSRRPRRKQTFLQASELRPLLAALGLTLIIAVGDSVLATSARRAAETTWRREPAFTPTITGRSPSCSAARPPSAIRSFGSAADHQSSRESSAAYVSMPSQRFRIRMFSFEACWLLS